MTSIPELASDIVKKTIAQGSDDNSQTLFFVGSKSAGKSTLLYSFLEKNETPRDTLVLEYSFGRKSGQKQGIEKIICHVWEYGGKLDLLKNVLISTPLNGKSYFVIMIDLSKIKLIWVTLETCIQAINENMNNNSSCEKIIIGGKYDLFKNYDSEIKKFVCTTIRSIALLNNAHVLFYSSKEPQLARKTKEILHNAGFGNGLVIKDRNVNYTKPLAIINRQDSWESIGIPELNIEQLKLRHLTRIPPEVEEKEIFGADIQRTHPEPILDSLAALKYEELRKMETVDNSISEYLMTL